MRLKIGITTYFVDSYEFDSSRLRGIAGQDMMMISMDNVRSIKLAGGLPIPIPLLHDNEYIRSFCENIDALVLTGGRDVYPLFYDTKVSKDCIIYSKQRDEFEMRLIDNALTLGKPIFGICRGMQLINVYFGGTLYQDIYSNGLTNVLHSNSRGAKHLPTHSVHFDENSFLGKMYGESMEVNSYHHQAIDNLGEGISAIAWAKEDNIVEGIICDKYDVFGVQWHPEMMIQEDKKQIKLYKHLMSLI